MNDSKKQSVETLAGTVEYETKTCVNCHSDVLIHETVYIGIDLYQTACSGHSRCSAKQIHASAQKTLCPACAEALFEFEKTPRMSTEERLTRSVAGMDRETRLIVTLLLVLMSALVVAIIPAVI